MDFRLTQLTAPAVAKSGAARHIIVKERLTRRARLHGFRPRLAPENMRKTACAWHIRQVIRTHPAMRSA
jgi:hypothetical protein